MLQAIRKWGGVEESGATRREGRMVVDGGNGPEEGNAVDDVGRVELKWRRRVEIRGCVCVLRGHCQADSWSDDTVCADSGGAFGFGGMEWSGGGLLEGRLDG